LPRPDGIIYFKISPDELFKRIKKRRKVILKHKGLTDEEVYGLSVLEIKKCEKVAEQLAILGVAVLTVDHSLEIGDIADNINNYIKSINHEKGDK